MKLFGFSNQSDSDHSNTQPMQTDPLNGYSFPQPPKMIYPTGSAEDLTQRAQAQIQVNLPGANIDGLDPNNAEQPSVTWQESSDNGFPPIVPGDSPA